MKKEKTKALVLSGGGARGAYQVGVLTAVSEIISNLKVNRPFQIITGVSAGSINACYLASDYQDFHLSVQRLSKMWSELTTDKVFRSDAATIGKISLRWVSELSLGGVIGTSPGKSLLDTTPLAELIKTRVDFSQIQQNINQHGLHAFGVTALDYITSEAITFVQGSSVEKMWVRARRKSEMTEIRTEHILGSSAIPLLFSPVKVGDRYFGDGCIRNHAPLSPAMHLGAEDLFVIGVRRNENDFQDLNVMSGRAPSVARVLNVLLNSILLDGVETDIERLKRINEFMRRVPSEHHEQLNFRKVNFVWIYPSKDIGTLAGQLSDRLPRIIRYLLKGLGPLEEAREIISYLLFEPEFTSTLIQYGYEDGIKSRKDIEQFFAN